ncbi:alpha/beta hydrolase fold domain-containing protein [Paenibacillus typhae]|uniref:alpha/beta hydrolase fold domain-containing protein n=1 Tax=Paenibacillus typhae TaxID=1174501 RepID=UPI001C8DF464|nr:alpha/beta hydrolase [Paenibacillus typhae]MBY0012091.1 alpha/beta hydrolase [Paenibacillus typhae]
MAVRTRNKRRSVRSFIFEKYIRLLGVKKMFSTVENTRKFVKREASENTRPYEIGKINVSSGVKEQRFEGMQVFTINDRNSAAQKVILYIHGGAWTKQPLPFHWRFMDKLARTLDAKIIAPLYPKVPHYSYKDAYPKLLNLYKEILGTIEGPEQLTLMGDSSGGNISLALAQLLKQEQLPQPKDIILLSAAVDLVFDNPLIPEYEQVDPMLSSGGMGVIINSWAGDQQLTAPIISPINSDFRGLARITHFVGTHEGLYPDALKLDEKLTSQGFAIETFVYPKMNHVFVIMPLPEAADALQKIADLIGLKRDSRAADS